MLRTAGRRCGTQLCNKHRCSSGHSFTAFLLTKRMSGGRTGTAPAAAAAAWCGRRAAGPPVPGRIPTGPAGRSRTTGTPASRPPGQRPRHRHPGTAARQAGLPGRLGHEPQPPGAGSPGQGTLVLQHAPPPPGPQPVSRTLPETRTMTTRHRARHVRCQPRHESGTLMATVTPSTSTPRRRTRGHRQMTLPPPHRAILKGAGQSLKGRGGPG